MIDIEDYEDGHEYDIEEFDSENFISEIYKWKRDIEDDLKKQPYNMNLLCVNEVLDTVIDHIQDNISIHSRYEDNDE